MTRTSTNNSAVSCHVTQTETPNNDWGICHILLCAGAPWSSEEERGGFNFVDSEK